MGKDQIATVSNIEFIAINTIEVTFVAPDDFKFLAGQYITITLSELKNKPDREQYRDFSIASPPEILPLFKVAFRQSKSFFKNTLSNLPIGSTVTFEGPAGVFTMPKDDKPLVFVAGGIGITPFASMLLAKQPHGHITLLNFNMSPKNAPYRTNLEKLTNINIINIYDRPKRLHFEDTVQKNTDARWFVAGPPAMVASVRPLLKALSVDDTMISTEEFTGYESNQ